MSGFAATILGRVYKLIEIRKNLLLVQKSCMPINTSLASWGCYCSFQDASAPSHSGPGLQWLFWNLELTSLCQLLKRLDFLLSHSFPTSSHFLHNLGDFSHWITFKNFSSFLIRNESKFWTYFGAVNDVGRGCLLGWDSIRAPVFEFLHLFVELLVCDLAVISNCVVFDHSLLNIVAGIFLKILHFVIAVSKFVFIRIFPIIIKLYVFRIKHIGSFSFRAFGFLKLVHVSSK